MGILDEMNACADEHIVNGGTCKTIIINGKSFKCCLDGNGEIISHTLKVLAQITDQ